jgi:glycosyltransferase involved in cell wall biosynthesis
VDLGAFDPGLFDSKAVAETRASFGLRVGVPVIGYVGRMIGERGILDLYDAFRRVRGRGANAQLFFLGDVLTSDGDQDTMRILRQRIAADELADDVRFAGFRNDVPRCVMAMDVVVLPSYHEGFPRIPVEAGAMGKAAVTTATTGCDVAVVHGQTGLIVPIHDVGALAEALWQLIATDGLAARMGRAGRRRVVELFDRERIVERQLEAYPRAYARAGLRWG